jgi:Tol biopolymer transport system component
LFAAIQICTSFEDMIHLTKTLRTILPVMLTVIGCPCICFSQEAAVNGGATIIDTNARAVVFAPGVVSTPYTEWATSFTPDGSTVYFSLGAVYWTIVSAKKTAVGWEKPKVASFSGRWRDTDPFVTPDGKRLFFISNRPPEGKPQDKAQPNMHIWYVDHLAGDEWGVPHYLGAPVNIEGVSNYAPSVSLKGTLYFCSRDRGGNTGMASYAAGKSGDQYETPQLMALLGKEDTQDPFIAPDERYIVFLSGNDLYITYYKEHGWSKAEKLPAEVNNGDSNSSPYVSPDGRTLYFSSSRIKGFYKRDPANMALDYDGLINENQLLFNGQTNILMIPVHLPKTS